MRRAVMCLLAAVAVLALLNLFGQRTSTSRAAAQRATLKVSVPRTVRGGLLLQGRGSLSDVRFAILETNGKISFLSDG